MRDIFLKKSIPEILNLIKKKRLIWIIFLTKQKKNIKLIKKKFAHGNLLIIKY